MAQIDVQNNLSLIRASIDQKTGGVILVAVSKFQPVETIMEAYTAGQRIFGESRVQELSVKQPALPDDIEWHFIGTLQTNKVKTIAPYIAMIQSADSPKLIREIDRQARLCNRVIPILLEVHIADETGKHGFTVDECKAFLASGEADEFENVRICGLMGMATLTDDSAQIRREFARLHRLFKKIRRMPAIDATIFTELSIGMSGDYIIAVEEGSTMVRIGTGIFGQRTT